jgi:hypothetical protein
MELPNFILKQFLIGGITFTTYALIIKYGFPNIAGLLSGAMPLAFTYTMVTVYLLQGRKQAITTSNYALYGAIMWIIFASTSHVLLKTNLNIWSILVISTVAWIIAVYILLKFVKPE